MADERPDPFSMAPQKALETIGKTLSSQYERWQPRARYKCQLDPTVDEVKKLCTTCRRYAKSERVLYRYNGHGVPKPTANGEIWLFNKSYTQYIPLPISDLDSWLKTPSIYLFDCSAAGNFVNAFIESASQVHGGQVAASFVDGSMSGLLNCLFVPHGHTSRNRVVGIRFQPGLDPSKIVSASQAGDIQFLDIRNYKAAYLTIEAHRGSLTSLSVHRHAPIIASGSAKQLIKVFSLYGVQLDTICYYYTFMAQKIGSVSCLSFHPYQLLLAAGAADACVSIYANDGNHAR